MPKDLFICGKPVWDEAKEEFIPATKDYTLHLEHSLISISKWEAIHKKPFLSSQNNKDELIDYIKCMTINNVPDEVYEKITPSNIDEVTKYIEDSQSATFFGKSPHQNGVMKGKTITAELVYCWMVQLNIPVEFEKWHLNRLLTLIHVISEENKPDSQRHKMTNAERKALNEARKAKYHTRG